jgi:hypothetical protein
VILVRSEQPRRVRPIAIGVLVATVWLPAFACRAQNGSVTHEACGAATLAQADRIAGEVSAIDLAVTHLPLTDSEVEALTSRAILASRALARAVEAYEHVIACHDPESTIAAHARRGTMFDRYYAALVPLGALSHALRLGAADTRCLAVTGHLLATRSSRARGSWSPDAAASLRAIQRTPTPDIEACVEHEIARDPTFARFTLSDLQAPSATE